MLISELLYSEIEKERQRERERERKRKREKLDGYVDRLGLKINTVNKSIIHYLLQEKKVLKIKKQKTKSERERERKFSKFMIIRFIKFSNGFLFLFSS